MHTHTHTYMNTLSPSLALSLSLSLSLSLALSLSLGGNLELHLAVPENLDLCAPVRVWGLVFFRIFFRGVLRLRVSGPGFMVHGVWSVDCGL